LNTPEVIAYLDTLEVEAMTFANKIREFKHILFESLDSGA